MSTIKKLSIIIPVYNTKLEYIKEAINSALNQTYKDVEIVLVNDGSTTVSDSELKEYFEKYKNIIFYNNIENKGVAYSRNKAIELANGEYILPLDADDIIESTYAEKAVNILNTMPSVGIVYCKSKIFGKSKKKWILPAFNKNDILFQNCIFNSAVYRKSDFISVGKYNENMIYGAEDHDLWLSFIGRGFEVYQIDEFLFNYRVTDEYSRSDFLGENMNKALLQLVNNHKDLYLNNPVCIDKIFARDKQKIIKYKKIIKILLYVFFIENILLVGGLLWVLH